MEKRTRRFKLHPTQARPETAAGASLECRKKALLPRQTLSLRTAGRLGWKGLKRRKLAVSLITLLCTAAFLFAGAADMLACYDKRTVLLKSLAVQKPDYLAVTKEYYNSYDFTTISKMLPTQEALDWFQSSGLSATGGEAGWYGGYMLDDADLAGLARRTGSLVKGVYVPSQDVMSIRQNYRIRSAAVLQSDYRYVTELRGFMELDADAMDAFGFTLLEGALPDSQKDEIVISKVLYDSFQALGYWGYGYYVGVSCTQSINGRQELGLLTIPWADFLADSVGALQALKESVAENDGVIDERNLYVKNDLSKTQVADIGQMSDLIGKTLFIENREYTVTGIVDTGFDPDSTEEEYLHEYQWGLAALAFVGAGKIQEIAARYPLAVTLQDFSFDLTYANSTVSVQRFLRASDLDPAYVVLPQGEAAMYISPSTSWNSAFKLPGTTYRLSDLAEWGRELSLSARWVQSGTSYRDETWESQALGYIPANGSGYTDKGLNAYNLDVFNEPMTNNIDLYSLIDAVVLEDHYFDLFTEGRAGQYAYGVAAGSGAPGGVTAIAEGCLREEDATRYRLEDLMAYQLDRLDGILQALAVMAFSISIGLVLFSALLFAVFIMTGLHARRKQIGIMRAMGASSRDVFAIFFAEGLLTAAISGAAATALTALTGIVGSALLQRLFDLRLTLLIFSPRQAVMIFALSFGIAILASLIPILRIARQKPVDAIRRS